MVSVWPHFWTGAMVEDFFLLVIWCRASIFSSLILVKVKVSSKESRVKILQIRLTYSQDQSGSIDLMQYLLRKEPRERGSDVAKDELQCLFLGIRQNWSLNRWPLRSILWCTEVPKLLDQDKKISLLPIVHRGRSTLKKTSSLSRKDIPPSSLFRVLL